MSKIIIISSIAAITSATVATFVWLMYKENTEWDLWTTEFSTTT
jgi:hypothetical protein